MIDVFDTRGSTFSHIHKSYNKSFEFLKKDLLIICLNYSILHATYKCCNLKLQFIRNNEDNSIYSLLIMLNRDYKLYKLVFHSNPPRVI